MWFSLNIKDAHKKTRKTKQEKQNKTRDFNVHNTLRNLFEPVIYLSKKTLLVNELSNLNALHHINQVDLKRK